jgi:uncharacterized membrane protein
MTQVITGMFDSFAVARNAVVELKNAGVDSDDISVVANNADDAYKLENDTAEEAKTGATAGAAIGGAGGLLAGLGLMAIPGIGPVVAAGWLVSTVAGGVAGAVAGAAVGGLISALTEAGVDEEEAEILAEHVRRGGAVICVRADDDQADEVRSIINRNKNIDLETRRSTLEEDGWAGFDADARPLNSREIQAERSRYMGR